MAHFEGFLGPNSPKYRPILLKFAPEVVFSKRKTVSKIFGKFKFLRKLHVAKVSTFFQFLRNFDPMKEAEIEKTNCPIRQNLGIVLSKYRKIKGLSGLNFSGKIRLLLALFWLFFAKKRGVATRWRVGIKISLSLFYQHNFWACFSAKSFVPALPSFAAIGCKGRFFKILNSIFKFGCDSVYNTQFLGKNKFDLPMQNLILSRLATIWNLKNQEQKSSCAILYLSHLVFGSI